MASSYLFINFIPCVKKHFYSLNNMAIVSTNSRINKFIEHGFTKEQAEFLVEEIVNEDSTKIKIDVEVIKRTMATKTDFRLAILELKTDLLKWMIPFFLTIIGLIITAFFKH